MSALAAESTLINDEVAPATDNLLEVRPSWSGCLCTSLLVDVATIPRDWMSSHGFGLWLALSEARWDRFNLPGITAEAVPFAV